MIIVSDEKGIYVRAIKCIDERVKSFIETQMQFYIKR